MSEQSQFNFPRARLANPLSVAAKDVDAADSHKANLELELLYVLLRLILKCWQFLHLYFRHRIV